MPSKIASTPGATAGTGSSWGRSAARTIRAMRLIASSAISYLSIRASSVQRPLRWPSSAPRTSKGMAPTPDTSQVLGTNSKVAPGSTKRRMAQAVAMRSTWIRSRLMKCMVSVSSVRIVSDQGQFRADALAEREATVDGPRGLRAARRVEVVACADLAEAALQRHQLLLGPQPQPMVVIRAGVFGGPHQEGLGVRAELFVLRSAVGTHLVTHVSLLGLAQIHHRHDPGVPAELLYLLSQPVQLLLKIISIRQDGGSRRQHRRSQPPQRAPHRDPRRTRPARQPPGKDEPPRCGVSHGRLAHADASGRRPCIARIGYERAR